MSDKDVARIIRAENKLKKKIGGDVSVKELLQPDVLEGAQGVINEKRDQFMELIFADVEAMERAYHTLTQDHKDMDAVVILLEKAESIRDRAGTFHYQLASQIAKSLAKYAHEVTDVTSETITVLRKHLDGLQTVFRKNIEGTGGGVGIELMDSLQKLVQKYHSNW